MEYILLIAFVLFLIWVLVRLIEYIKKPTTNNTATSERKAIPENSILYYDRLRGYTEYNVFFDGRNVFYQGQKIGEYEFDGEYLNVYPFNSSKPTIKVWGSFKEQDSYNKYFCSNISYLERCCEKGIYDEGYYASDEYEIFFDEKFIIFDRNSDRFSAYYSGDLYGVLASLVCTQAVLVNDGIMYPCFNK